MLSKSKLKIGFCCQPLRTAVNPTLQFTTSKMSNFMVHSVKNSLKLKYNNVIPKKEPFIVCSEQIVIFITENRC